MTRFAILVAFLAGYLAGQTSASSSAPSAVVRVQSGLNGAPNVPGGISALGEVRESAVGWHPYPDPVPGGAPPSPTPDPGTTAPPSETWTRQGIASTYGPGWDGWTASPWPRGTTIEVCGPGGCAIRTTNDVGPNQRIHPDRVVDLDVPTFEAVCGASWWMGLCPVTVTVLRRG